MLESPLDNKELDAILELIREGEYIDNKKLMEAMQEDEDLLQYLFQNTDKVF